MAGLAALLLGDARLPVGGHTQSAGLEAAVLAGITAADVPAYLEVRLRTVATVDAATAVVALRALRAGGGAPLELVHAHWAARTPSHVQRRAAEAAAHGYLRLARRLGGVPEVPLARPLTMAALAGVLGVGAGDLAAAVLHDEIQTVTSAALKLVPLDPSVAVEWAVALHPLADSIAREVASLSHPDEIPYPSAPLLEVWIDHHAHAQRRLFSA